MSNIKNLERIATQLRRDALRMVNSPKSGHPGGSLSSADLFAALFFEVMEHNPKDFTIDGKNQDLFFLSCGHLAPIWYSALARSGYFEISELATLRKLGTRLQGHPTNADGLPGIRIASGSLGQGISVASGAALSKKMNNDNKLVFVLTGDGELQEGQIWEALMFATNHKIDNLIIIVDYNKKQIDGPIDEVIAMGNLKTKFEAFGCLTLETQGNNLSELVSCLKEAKKQTGNKKPIAILMHTTMGKGVDFMENKHDWHGVAPDDAQLKNALSQLEETLGDY